MHVRRRQFCLRIYKRGGHSVDDIRMCGVQVSNSILTVYILICNTSLECSCYMVGGSHQGRLPLAIPPALTAPDVLSMAVYLEDGAEEASLRRRQ